VKAATERDDAELVRDALLGDVDAFGTLVEKYRVRLYRFVERYTNDAEDARDVTQEVFLKVHAALDSYDSKYKFSTWLFRIAGNAAIDHLRKKRPKTVPLEVPDPDGPGRVSSGEYSSSDLDPYGMLRNVERGQAISEAIADLPVEFRELIALRHFAGLSYEEIAEVKQMPLGTVKNKLFRARAVLKERLAGEFS
jgi:RNA polymerase sigma-70 factor (ECF subfamily)